MTKEHPLYDNLPINPTYPPHSAWGVWGIHDAIGTLNLIPKDQIIKSFKYIKYRQEEKSCEHKVFSLTWIPNQRNTHLFSRGHIPQSIRARIHNFPETDFSYDDYVQTIKSPTEWHNLRSFSSADDAYCRFYNGISLGEVISSCRAPKAQEDLSYTQGPKVGVNSKGASATSVVAGRAILLDYARWASSYVNTNKDEYNPLQRTAITAQELEKVAESQGLTAPYFQRGDILLIRTGWITAYENAKDISTGFNIMKPQCAGIETSENMFRWLWNYGLAALATDSFSFEAFPPQPMDGGSSCHSRLIGSWGMTVGELFNLDEMAEASANNNIYEYYFKSEISINNQQGFPTCSFYATSSF
ncbi:hypothetical protein BDA99DRAFT_604549 [Phascolomyces articulosus]|uniref:Cyclase n=1 Tax=Phascolomyces articulosus TaxID=60185 RepID=A0AAD5KB23_9FUNG|nr:hypothetical protein BDA99DRAFT_604549 [Phascolomyces articulosus]